ncbi:putative extracellular exo-polygalacturonase [Aspergillus clavatus NRRL 1]|uniref:galacturonan 1,4-alpha-galacturonidase n=1 Tax=Aspergillus clavatus (strain ATCC 1007 / CBS 513.65 / DSM 816 / NCTC 3887 / NRRL 1 / QM 1276 / 107) TaxID=344612 RepID=A1C8F5_ASPCL|nr:uncharacterized protein ACLA_043100 [Aspergillus clavatus NRRL 1]EAW13592.1 predicted protein [Aspergillus clavatus NRRL 1]
MERFYRRRNFSRPLQTTPLLISNTVYRRCAVLAGGHFYFDFQKPITFWRWGGQDIRIFGSGVMNGNGQRWYNEFAGFIDTDKFQDSNNKYYRPILFVTDNATRLSVEGIAQLNSPCWTNFFVRTKDVLFDNVYIKCLLDQRICKWDSLSGASQVLPPFNQALPKNTDGFDSLNVDGLSVTNARVDIGDGSFSPKPNTTNNFVQKLWCNNTHGVSMGSIGQDRGVLDMIEYAYIENVILLSGEYYFKIDAAGCASFSSKFNVTNINFENISGTSSGKQGKVVADLTCSPNAVCLDVHLKNINLSSPAGDLPVIICDGIQGDIGVECQYSSTSSTTKRTTGLASG